MDPIKRDFGLENYETVMEDMVSFITKRKTQKLPDEIWFGEHPEVFSLGKKASRSNLLFNPGFPVIESDRGGEITYHGPGQFIVYPLLDLKTLSLTPKGYLERLMASITQTLGEFGIKGVRLAGYPGVFVASENTSPPPFKNLCKISSVGLKISKGLVYHGISVNISCNLSHFDYINPCGYKGLKNINLLDLLPEADPQLFKKKLIDNLISNIYKS